MALLMENYVPGTPEIPAEDIEEAFRGMADYIFVTNEPDGSKTFICSRCGEKYNLRFPARTYTNAEEDLFRAKHREYGTCVKCGFNAGIINTGRKKRLSDLREEKAAAFVLPVSECVGGYAARHANGETTILFMRSAAWPDKPLYTIEMQGKELIQVHGYHNRTAPRDIPAANEFFESWLKWVKGGSKRPKLHKKTKETERAISA